MRFDKQNLVCDDQAITVTAVSTDKIDLNGGTPAFTTDSLGNTPPNDLFRSPGVEVECLVTETFTSGGATTLNVDLVTDDDSALGSPTIHQSTGAIAKATLVAGYRFRLALPYGFNPAAQRYFGLSFTVATGPFTAGKITAGLVHPSNKQTAPGSMS